MAHHGQREALWLQDAARRALPERAGARARKARLRHREDPCRRPLRDRRRRTHGNRGVLDPPRRDRGGDGRPRPSCNGGEPAPRPARRPDDPGRKTRCRPGGTPGRLGKAGRRSRLRCARARGGGAGKSRVRGRTGEDGDDASAGTVPGTGSPDIERETASPEMPAAQTGLPPRPWPGPSPISRSARRCSSATISSPPCSRGVPAR